MAVFDFEYYLSKGVVKRKRVDISLAESLLKAAKDRFNFAKSLAETKPKYALENAYEAVIEIIDALMALKGFKSWSHEANIAFLRKFGFSENEIRRLDVSRSKRHGSKYYGVEFSATEVKNEIEFLEEIFEKIVNLIEEGLKSY